MLPEPKPIKNEKLNVRVISKTARHVEGRAIDDDAKLWIKDWATCRLLNKFGRFGLNSDGLGFSLFVFDSYDLDEVATWLESFNDEPEEEKSLAYRVVTDLLCNSREEAGERLIRIGTGILMGDLKFEPSEDHELSDLVYFAKD